MAIQIFIDDQIGYNWWTGGGITYRWFKKQFDTALATDEEIEVRINTPGGSIMEGTAIYNLIAANRDRVSTINEGFAYSMGAVLLSAGGKRKAYKNATTMIHNASGGASGNSKDLKGAMEMLVKLDDAMAESLAQFSGKPKEDIIAEYMDFQDHTLSAAEALEAGILTEVIELNSETVPTSTKALSHTEVIALFHSKSNTHSEDSIFQKILGRIRDINPAALIKPIETSQENLSDMKITLTAQLVAIAAIAGITAKEGDEAEFTAEHFEKISAHVASVASQLETANTAKTKAETDLATANTNLANATTAAASWKEKYEAMPGATHTPVGTEGDPNPGATAEYDWTKSASAHATLATKNF